jgi:hypothetical protein
MINSRNKPSEPTDGLGEHDTLEDVVVFCDESGAKGYADKPEKELGEVGVFAGFPVQRADVERLAYDFRKGLEEFREGSSGKIHIADLSPENQEKLRRKVYTILLGREVPCFYEAVHVQGFHAAYKQACELGEMLAANLGKRPKRKLPPQSLHVHLFLGFYGKILSFCRRLGITRMTVEIRIDRVDGPILEEFRSAARDILTGTKKYPTKHYDPIAKKVTKGIATWKIESPSAPIDVQACVIRSTAKYPDLILAADVLANSLSHDLRNRASDQKLGPLNIKKAVSTHPLARLLQSGQSRLVYDFADGWFSHPQNPTRKTPHSKSES